MGTQASRSTDHGGLQIDSGDGSVVASLALLFKNSVAHYGLAISVPLKLGQPSD
jgi:lipoate-protein ligase B